ncbi:MAG: MerR family transcriptional regulator [Actinobacteria bacterium]|nr:MerR family transcriptional regulator [Actinomycetota bacterium]
MSEFLTVAAVARRLGIAPATLRTWDRRYCLGPSLHEAGNHRRYSSGDLARLTLMRRLVIEGMAPCEAAQRAKALCSEETVGEVLHAVESAEAAGKSCDELVNTFYRAALTLDDCFLETGLRQEIERTGVIKTWQEIMVPLLVKIGDDWARTEQGIEVEHMFSEIVRRVLQTVQVKEARNPRPVLLAAPSEEQHSLALYAIRAALAERSIASYFLGARTPYEAVARIVERIAPPVIFLWALLPENGDPQFFRELPKVRPAPRVILGGPGWDQNECKDVLLSHDLFSACEEISRVVGV